MGPTKFVEMENVVKITKKSIGFDENRVVFMPLSTGFQCHRSTHLSHSPSWVAESTAQYQSRPPLQSPPPKIDPSWVHLPSLQSPLESTASAMPNIDPSRVHLLPLPWGFGSVYREFWSIYRDFIRFSKNFPPNFKIWIWTEFRRILPKFMIFVETGGDRVHIDIWILADRGVQKPRMISTT
jgi:hypothetical protein